MEYFNTFETANFLLLYLKIMYRRRSLYSVHVNSVKSSNASCGLDGFDRLSSNGNPGDNDNPGENERERGAILN